MITEREWVHRVAVKTCVAHVSTCAIISFSRPLFSCAASEALP